MSLLKRPMIILTFDCLFGAGAPELSIHGCGHGSWIAGGSGRVAQMRVAARVQERYMRNNSSQGRIDARRNSRPCRGNQAVRAAAEEASLTLTLQRVASPN